MYVRGKVLEDHPVIVIGTGPPGAAAALALAEAGVSVLVIEAGERQAPGFTARIEGITVAKQRKELKHRERVTHTGDPNSELYEELSPGGLSNHWSCAVPRFSEEDFADAARAGEEYAWPVGYADLTPWYDWVEPMLHIAGGTEDVAHLPAGKVRHRRVLAERWTLAVDRAEAHGRSLTPMPYAYGDDTTFTLGGTVFNAFYRLIRPAERQRRLKVLCGARVLRLDWSERTRRVESVTVWNNRLGIEERIPCRAVVVAAGAINSAQILLESTSADFPNGLGNEHDVLGRYLHDHPVAKLVLDFPEGLNVHPPAYFTRPALDRAPPLYAAACMQWSSTSMFAESVLRGKPNRLRWLGFSVFGTMAPTRDNFIALDRANQARELGSALILNVRHPPEAHPALESAKNDLVEVLDQAGWRPEVRIWKIEPVGNSNHYGGTVRMHASPRFGMADSVGRLHSVRNVAIGDSSVFTTGPEKNPVLTSMALAARAGNRLAQDLRSGDL